MNLLLASTSTLFGGQYLGYLRENIEELFKGIQEIIFIPFARPGGISHDEYTLKVQVFFSGLNIGVKGLHEFDRPEEALDRGDAYFTGGGNTFLLVKTLHERGLIHLLKENIKKGKPYLGASAGSNIGGVNMKTSNDMPIVYPSSFECMGLVPFNINPHYLDPQPDLKHNGETRETRILEFLTQNNIPVVGLREGNWIRRVGDRITTEGSQLTRVFVKNGEPYELEAGSELKF
ncbi:dipeptidase PepE [Elizabethkingia argentiflava]|uniref:Dipeptidase PepE n=1 Tax=Elizabethkingia argenteiflava TaxID=2681556 RepID=A0A845PPQ8_9FLAO|nr:dipeptidase PepE [Elizabethkingia argenteiflava]NAW50309.1 dipeptidase PepE [Elizabethkingia argenteiflava]